MVSISGAKDGGLADKLGRNMSPVHKDIYVQTAQVPPQALDVPLIGMCPPRTPPPTPLLQDEACRVCLRHVPVELTCEWPEPVQP